jgi:hypothetical protein
VLSAVGDVLFPASVTSDAADETGLCQLSLLAPGTYDLVVASITETGGSEVLGIVSDVTVSSLKTNTQNIDISQF